MTSKTDFTEEEWTRLKRAPFVAGMAISLADPGGPIEAVKETSATLKTVRAAESGGRGELVGALASEVVQEAGQRKNPLGGFKPSKGANAGVEILEELREANQIVAGKATPDDAAAFREWSRGRQGGRERREGRRLHGLPRRAGERGRAADAGQPRGSARSPAVLTAIAMRFTPCG